MLNRNKVGYIRQDDYKYIKFRERIVMLFRKIFIIVKAETIENGTIISIPRYKKINKLIKGILANKVKKSIKYNKIDYIVLEENLIFLRKKLRKENILSGKYIMKKLLPEIIDYIFKVNKKNMCLEDIYVFVNEYTKNNIYQIEKLVEKFKTVNIITENMKYYRKLEESLYSNGILITVSNNRRKGARKAKYIVNIDFDRNTLEKYNINMNAIIVNLTEEKIFFENRFNGVLVNNFNIICDDNYNCYINEFFGDIDKKIYLESILYSENDYYGKTEELYSRYGMKIEGLVGVRGNLENCEFLV